MMRAESAFVFELLFFVFALGGLLIQNWSVYHVTLLFNCNTTVLWSSALFLSGRVLKAGLGAVMREQPDALGPDLAAVLAVVAAQIVGSASYLGRGLLDNHRLSRLLVFGALPAGLWGCWRIALWRLAGLDEKQAAKEEGKSLGSRPRRELRRVMWRGAVVLEQSAVIGYVVGVLPAVFASDPHLFFDWGRCVALALSVALSSAAILGLWTVHVRVDRLWSLWCLLGAWEKGSAGSSSPREWSARKAYAAGTAVSHGGKTFVAVGPLESNLAAPGSFGATLLRVGVGSGLSRPYDAAIALQTGLVAMHVLLSWARPHYVSDLCVALLYCPVVIFFVVMRRAALKAAQ